jgi:hypothetical protein
MNKQKTKAPPRSRPVTRGRIKLRTTGPGEETPARKATERAMAKARRNVDIEYRQGQAREMRRPGARQIRSG